MDGRCIPVLFCYNLYAWVGPSPLEQPTEGTFNAAESRLQSRTGTFRRKLSAISPVQQAPPISPDVNALRNDCHQLRFFPSTVVWQGPLGATYSSLYFLASFLMTMFLPVHSFTFSFCLSIFYHSFSKG